MLSVQSYAEERVSEIEWARLMPDGERAPMPLFGHMNTGLDLDIPEQSDDFRTNDQLPSGRVRMRGFVVPLEIRRGSVERFLLVPYFGACIHLPPPPPNQIIDITLAEPMRLNGLYTSVTVEGALLAETSRTAMANTAYVMRSARAKPDR